MLSKMYGFEIIYLPWFPKLLILSVSGVWLKWRLLSKEKSSDALKHSVAFTATNIVVGLFILPWVPVSFSLAKPSSLFLLYAISVSVATLSEIFVGSFVLKYQAKELKKIFAANLLLACLGVGITIHNLS